MHFGIVPQMNNSIEKVSTIFNFSKKKHTQQGRGKRDKRPWGIKVKFAMVDSGHAT